AGNRGDPPSVGTDAHELHELPGGMVEPREESPVIGGEYEQGGTVVAERADPPSLVDELELFDEPARLVQPGDEPARRGVPQFNRTFPAQIVRFADGFLLLLGNRLPGQQPTGADLGIVAQ